MKVFQEHIVIIALDLEETRRARVLTSRRLFSRLSKAGLHGGTTTLGPDRDYIRFSDEGFSQGLTDGEISDRIAWVLSNTGREFKGKS